MNRNNSSSIYQFKRESHDGTISYILLPIARLADAIKVLNLGFYPSENVSICTEVAKNPKAVAELNELSQECIKDGVSIVAIENATYQIIGVSINKIQKKVVDPSTEPSFFEKFVQTKCSEKESVSLINFMIECDAYINVFEHYSTTKVMELMFLAVLPQYRKSNIGSQLVHCDLQLANYLSMNFNGPSVVVVLCTSKYSQRICEKLHFETLKTIPYSQFEYEGVKYSDKLQPEHFGVSIVAKASAEETGHQKPRIE